MTRVLPNQRNKMTNNNSASDFSILYSIEDNRWNDIEQLEPLSETTISAALSWLIDKYAQPFPLRVDDQELELSVLFTNDAQIQTINAQWRQQDKPTNVLSFPSSDMKPGSTPLPILGDLIFAFETIEREAHELNKPIKDHLTHLLVHGFLHLFGYDHIEPDEADEMEAIETGILASIGLSNPYQDY